MQKIAFSSDPVNTFEEHPRESSNPPSGNDHIIPPVIDAFLNSSNFGEGYVVLSRSSLHSEVFQDKDPFYWKAWTWMLMKANHAGVERNGFVYQRGEFYTWYGEIIESLTCCKRHKRIVPTKQQIRVMLRWFTRRGMIEVTPVEKLTGSSHSFHNKGFDGRHRGEYDGVKIRIINYDAYQTGENYRKTEKNTHWNTLGTQVEPNNNNEKNEKNEFEEKIMCDSVKAKEPKKRSSPNPDVKAFMDRWDELFLNKFDHHYVVNEKKDHALIATRLETASLDELVRLAERLFSEGDEWADKEAGYTIPVFNSLIPKLVSKKKKLPRGLDDYSKYR